MNTLQDILYRSRAKEVVGPLGLKISSIAFDSRQVASGSLFIAVVGTQVDGHKFISSAIDKGAIAIVCEKLPLKLKKDITYVVVENTAEALGFIAANFYDNPSENIKIIGVTGTNGKTTIVTLLTNLFTSMGYKTGMLSTIQNKVGNKILKSTHTTPDAININKLLHQMVEEGCDYAFMEVSSHAIDQHRLAGINFAGGIFTNITHDHLDYHKTFKNYIKAKKTFFDKLPKSAFALTNADDKNGNIMLQNTAATKYTYGLKGISSFKGKIIENDFEGMMLNIDGNEVYSLLSGRFNAYNLLSVYATSILLNQDKEDTLVKISMLKGAEGRFEIIKSKNNITAIIDYAHTPDALENVISTINKIRTHNEQLITVVGAGGDRDKSKRPIMAKVASMLSNRVILTSDNPRNEDPTQILNDMRVGIDPAKKKSTMVISDRREAIITAFNLAQEGDMILIAGKGHEKYQDIAGVKHHFDDKEIMKELMEIN